MDLNDCPCSGKTLARLVQPAVMAVLAKESLHGYLIVQRLSAMRLFRDQAPDPTGVYRVLKTMEQEGFVKSSWQLADSGPAKRSFALTPAGRLCLNHWACSLQDYHASVSDLLTVITHAVTAKPASKKSSKGSAPCSPASRCCGNASPK